MNLFLSKDDIILPIDYGDLVWERPNHDRRPTLKTADG